MYNPEHRFFEHFTLFPVSLYLNKFKSSPDCLLLLWLGVCFPCLESGLVVCFKVNEHQRHLEKSRLSVFSITYDQFPPFL